ncbi:hypothetical protein [Catenuloplanes atrovinosus]|uniref:Secreted protein n=1 Tax=Catenuloplanes atrovinosus TaxID=137266 RepID=A0AAE3YLV0_9ACTN|nr:hypothetical protein [Catenuloplanes atrovinosus]MDR7275377.1 hypothetical protein [Catenuloplanes atrovinosus]
MSMKRFGVLTALALAAALIPGAAAQADTGAPLSASGKAFVAESRAAGLTAEQANGLQAKVDEYLSTLGEGATQVGPDKITSDGSDLFVTVPGEDRPRGLSSPEDAKLLAVPCPYYYFCAFSGEQFTGDARLEDDCGTWISIPFWGYGSWINNQTPGTQPTAYFNNGTAPWRMPGAYAEARAGVLWDPVVNIDPC